MSRTLVVGAGVTGLAAALGLARRGLPVEVIDAAASPGGLAFGPTFHGVPCDLGSHRLHPSALDLPLFAQIHRSEPFLTRPRRGVLLLRGSRIPYPPTAVHLARALGVRAALDVARTFGFGPHRAAAPWSAGENTADRGFEAFVVERVGRRSFELFYGPYARKLWGVDPATLSQAVAKKRWSTSSPWALLSPFAGNQRLSGHFLYPARGIRSLIEHLVAQLERLRVPLHLGRPYPSANRARLNLGEPNTRIVYTGRLRDLVPTPLAHRGLYLVYLAFPAFDDACSEPAETYYVPETAYPFGRVSFPARYSPVLAPAGQTIVCVEIPEGALGPGIDFSSPSRLQSLLDALRELRIIPPRPDPIDLKALFVPDVYPLYFRGFRRTWDEALARVAALQNVYPAGRQALFLHCNLDHGVAIADDLVAHMVAGGSAEAWIAQVSRYLSIVVRD